MSRRLASTASIVVALLLVGTAGARPGRHSETRTLRIPRPAMVAADGSTAAVATDCGPRVYWLYAWTPVRRSTVSIAPPHQRKCYFESTGDGVWEHGIAGRRIAWVAFTGGNLRQSWLVTATIGKPRSTTTLTGPLDRVTGSGVGDWVGNVHGDRSLLVFNTWSLCDSLDAGMHNIDASNSTLTRHRSSLSGEDEYTQPSRCRSRARPVRAHAICISHKGCYPTVAATGAPWT